MAVALDPLIKLAGGGYFEGDMDPLTIAISVCPTICFAGDVRDEAIVTLEGEAATTADLAGDTTDFKGDDKSGDADLLID